jgi:ribosome-associated translation inhibitor RaiA
MKFQIKSLSGGLDENQKQYLRKKFLWLEEHLPNSATLTVAVRENVTKRSNQAFEVITHLIIPKLKRPIYVRTYKNTFTEAVDTVRNKIERTVIKNKEKSRRFNLKMPKVKIKFRFIRKKKEENETTLK